MCICQFIVSLGCASSKISPQSSSPLILNKKCIALKTLVPSSFVMTKHACQHQLSNYYLLDIHVHVYTDTTTSSARNVHVYVD